MTLHRDLMTTRQLEAENAMQRRLVNPSYHLYTKPINSYLQLSKLSSERDALVGVVGNPFFFNALLSLIHLALICFDLAVNQPLWVATSQ